MEQEDKITNEETSVNLGCVKKELEEESVFAENPYKVASTYENIFGETSEEQRRNLDSLISFLDDDIITTTKTGTIKLEDVKEDNENVIGRNIEEFHFETIQCDRCKVWLEKDEQLESHMVHCLENYNRTRSGNSEAVDRSDTDEAVIDDCDTKDGKRRYRGGNICSRRKDRRNKLKFNTKDYQCVSGRNDETRLNECSALMERSNDEQIQNNRIGTNSSHQLHDNLNKHKGVKRFKCDICMMKFTQKSSVKTHVKNKHTGDKNKDYKCLECPSKFRHKCSLEIHVKNKHANDGGVKDFKCSECSYATNYKGDLRRHLNRHRGYIKLFQCGICMFNYTRKEHLARHIKHKHTDGGSAKKVYNAKDFKCSECSYATNYKSDLQRHLNKHRANIKQFQCDICMAMFPRKYHLTRHTKNKHTDDDAVKDYKCSECVYQSNDKCNFQYHLNKHKGIKLFQCDICMGKFTKKCNLAAHIRNKHTKDKSLKD